jgi:hypothetical protein
MRKLRLPKKLLSNQQWTVRTVASFGFHHLLRMMKMKWEQAW